MQRLHGTIGEVVSSFRKSLPLTYSSRAGGAGLGITNNATLSPFMDISSTPPLFVTICQLESQRLVKEVSDNLLAIGHLIKSKFSLQLNLNFGHRENAFPARFFSG